MVWGVTVSVDGGTRRADQVVRAWFSFPNHDLLPRGSSAVFREIGRDPVLCADCRGPLDPHASSPDTGLLCRALRRLPLVFRKRPGGDCLAWMRGYTDVFIIRDARGDGKPNCPRTCRPAAGRPLTGQDRYGMRGRDARSPPALGYFPYLISPPIIVMVTVISLICSGGIARGSRSRTTRSARLPA
jgi:hypothetical protein